MSDDEIRDRAIGEAWDAIDELMSDGRSRTAVATAAYEAMRPVIERATWLAAAEHVRRLAPSAHESAGACEACAYATAASSLALRAERMTGGAS